MVSDPLGDLIDKLILYHGGPDSFRRKLEGELPARSSARRWLLSQAYSEVLSVDELTEIVRDATRRAFCAMTPKEAILAVCEFDALLKLLEQEKTLRFDPMDVDKQVLTTALLEAWNVLQIGVDNHTGPVWANQEIQALEKHLLADLDRGVLHPLDAHSAQVAAVAAVQQVLEFCLAYHVLCFLDWLPESTLETLQQILRRRSYDAAWKAIEFMETIFSQGGVSAGSLRQLRDAEKQVRRRKEEERRAESDAHERICRCDIIARELARTTLWIEEREGKANQGDLQAMRARKESLNKMLEKHQKAVKESSLRIKQKRAETDAARCELERIENIVLDEKREMADGLKRKCRGFLARRSPFEGLGISVDEVLRVQVGRNRNLPAHSTPSQVIDSFIKVVDAKDKVNLARSVIDGMRAKQYLPRIVVLVGEGEDVYGQRMVYFVDVHEFRELKGALPRELDWMYVLQDFPYEHFRVLVVLAPFRDSSVDEPSVELLTQDRDEVRAMMRYLRGERETWRVEPSVSATH